MLSQDEVDALQAELAALIVKLQNKIEYVTVKGMGVSNVSQVDLVEITSLHKRSQEIRSKLHAAGRTSAGTPTLNPVTNPPSTPIGGLIMPAATSTPYANRDPANAANAAKCPIHKTRMVYEADGEGAWLCKQVDRDGALCGFRGYPYVRDIQLLKSQRYNGNVRVLAATGKTVSGETSTEIYLLLTEIGMVVNVTSYVDLTAADAIQVDENQGCKMALAFDRIDFSVPSETNPVAA